MLTDLRTQTSPYIFCESFSYTGLRERKRHRTAYCVYFLSYTGLLYRRTQTSLVIVSKFLTQVLDGLLDDANVAVLYL